jgi:hypothetical protein
MVLSADERMSAEEPSQQAARQLVSVMFHCVTFLAGRPHFLRSCELRQPASIHLDHHLRLPWHSICSPRVFFDKHEKKLVVAAWRVGKWEEMLCMWRRRGVSSYVSIE